MDNEELERRAKITNETCGGIQPMHKVFYSLSIKYSADRCLNAFRVYDYLLSKNADAEELISSVQEAIGHAAALSRYFWPTSMGKKKIAKEQMDMRQSRGELLRNQYGVTDDSPISDRDIRNAWEHFDEKLDIYVLSHDAGYFFPSPILGDHSLADEAIGKIFKLIDPTNECLVLLGNKYFFRPIRDEVERIFNE
ncbi:hypothetical protein Q4575_19645 [Psychrosphaera sp. 1_MG-2023]|uniref:hypothetical protein n=1 Tax=Psychrosphaera sp. 1_MG-2023 TaxID=3062643 RepID=UPI0026E397F1|nr:hypothetical protein [Psychrosphaera sp. 1_MG-2023]MDO6721618.1 hypothetical protein [Psychrosphaera sp. 1_MG-2023]